MSSNGNVTYLNTNQFTDTVKAFKEAAKKYNEIKFGIENTTNALFFNWQGEGKKQFEKEYLVIYQQLSDIAEILYELRDAVIDAQAQYVLADDKIAKGIIASQE